MEIITGIDFAGTQSDKTASLKITFVEAEAIKQRYYCNMCFFGFKKELLQTFLKPFGHTCGIGSKGYYVATKKEEQLCKTKNHD